MTTSIRMSYYTTTWAMIDRGYELDWRDTCLSEDDLPDDRHLVVVEAGDKASLDEVRKILRVTRAGHVPMVRRRERWEAMTVERGPVDAIVIVVVDPARAEFLRKMVEDRRSRTPRERVVRVGHAAPPL